jgi:hypothetical protein
MGRSWRDREGEDAMRIRSCKSNPIWVFSFPHQLALPEREMAGWWWQRP